MSLRSYANNKKCQLIGTAIIMQVAVGIGPVAADQASGEASYLIERLLDADAQTQLAVVHDLERMGRAAVPPLMAAASSNNTLQRWQAIEILGRLSEDAEDAVPLLIEALRDPEPQIRRNAAWALGRVGHAAFSAMPALLVTANDVEWDVRADAVWAVGKVASREQTIDTVDALVAALDDESLHVRWSAAWSLARIGSAAAAAVPALVNLLDDASWKLRASAAAALAKVAAQDQGDLIVPALTLATADRNRLVRKRATAALRAFRSGVAPASEHRSSAPDRRVGLR